MSDEEWTDEILGWCAALVLSARSEYLAGGANPLKHWKQIETRLVAACRTSSQVRTMATKFLRGLGVSASPGCSTAILQLDELVKSPTRSRIAVRKIYTHSAYVIALARADLQEKA